MGIELISGIVALLVLVITFVIKRLNQKKDNQNAMGQVDDTVLRESMDTVDRLYPPPR